MTRYGIGLLLACAFTTTAAVAGTAPPTHYSVIDLDPAGASSNAVAINDVGQVFGYTYAKMQEDGNVLDAQRFLWQSHHTAPVDPGTPLDFNNGISFGFNNGKTFVWQNNTRMAVTGLPPGGDIFVGGAIQVAGVNDAGQVAGSQEGIAREHAFLWSRADCVDLGSLDGTGSWANALNNHAQVVGMSDAPGGRQHAFLWQNGKMQDIGLKIGGRYSEATAINDKGQVVGDMLPSGIDATLGIRYGFLYDAGRVTLLGALQGDTSTHVDALNASGAVVGWSGHLVTGKEVERAVLWNGGKVYDLNKFIPAKSGWALYEATGINVRGQIIGNGFFHGHRRTFLLTSQ